MKPGAIDTPGPNYDTCQRSGAVLLKFPMSNAPPLSFVLGASWRDEESGLIKGIFTDATVDDGLHLMWRVAQLLWSPRMRRLKFCQTHDLIIGE